MDEFRKQCAIFFYRRFLLLAYLVLLIPLWGPLTVWAIFQPESIIAKRLLAFAILTCVPLSLWYAHLAGYYMAVEFQSFSVATRRALGPLLLKLSFLPLVGHRIEKLVLPDSKDAASGEQEWED